MTAPLTPDGRYIVVRGRLWRAANPDLVPERRAELVGALMDARRAVRAALRSGDGDALTRARAAVDAAKRGLGERGPAWWGDGPDYHRHMAKNTPYADWFADVEQKRNIVVEGEKENDDDQHGQSQDPPGVERGKRPGGLDHG